MNIRRATEADVAAIVRLNRTVQGMHAAALPEIFRDEAADSVVAGAFREALAAPTAFWLIAEELGPVAFLMSEYRERPETWCAKAARVCYLAGLAVDPQSQKKGIARQMVDELKRECSARGVIRIEVDAWTFNYGAKEVYARLGFVPVMERMMLGLA